MWMRLTEGTGWRPLVSLIYIDRRSVSGYGESACSHCFGKNPLAVQKVIVMVKVMIFGVLRTPKIITMHDYPKRLSEFIRSSG